jgi:hypothetical protein
LNQLAFSKLDDPDFTSGLLSTVARDELILLRLEQHQCIRVLEEELPSAFKARAYFILNVLLFASSQQRNSATSTKHGFKQC